MTGKTDHFKALTSNSHSSAIADHMTQTGHVVVNYLPNAFAFIYVINSGNARGVQKDRVSVFNFLYYDTPKLCKATDC